MDTQTGRVLVVEDDPGIRAFLVEAFQDQGYEALAAANGLQALELLAGEPRRPDAIVLDMRMPAMDGATFAEAYRRSPEPRAPIVVLTAWRRELDRAALAGVERVLIKPPDLETLLAEVECQVQKHRQRGGAAPMSFGLLTGAWLPLIASLLAAIPGIVALVYH